MIVASSSTDRSALLLDESARRIEWMTLVTGGLWIVILQCLDWPIFLYAHDGAAARVDSAVFAYAGDLIRHGGIPYVSYWDHKPPLIHVINAAALVLAGGNLWGVWFASLFALLAAMVLGYRALRQALNSTATMFGIGFFVLSLSNVLASNHTETYVLPLQWAAVLLLLRWHPSMQSEKEHALLGFLLGLLAGLQFLLRPNLVASSISVACVLSVLLVSERRWAALGRFIVGGMFGVGLIMSTVVGFLAWHGAFSSFLDQVFHYNAIYSEVAWKLRIRAMYFGLKFSGQYGPMLPLAGWLLAGYLLAVRGRRHPLFPVFLLGLIWLPLELMAASVSGRTYANYYMPLLGPQALLTAVLAAQLLESVPQAMRDGWRTPRTAFTFLLIAMAALTVTDSAMKVRDWGLRLGRMDQIPDTARYIRQHTNAKEKILVWGHAADLYLLSERQPASRFIYPLALLTPGYTDAALVDAFLHEIQTANPALIIDATRVGLRARGGEAAVPSLDTWQPEWVHPDPRDPSVAALGLRSTWAVTPSLKRFYDYVDANYSLIEQVGPQSWGIYRRSMAGKNS